MNQRPVLVSAYSKSKSPVKQSPLKGGQPHYIRPKNINLERETQRLQAEFNKEMN